MNFTPDPNLHLIICYDTKSSLYLQASIMEVHEVEGRVAIQPLLVFSKEDTAEYLSQVLMENLQWRDYTYPNSRGLY